MVTVIIAAYQRPQTLNRTLRALYRQTYGEWRALVVADCCPDNFFTQVDRSDDRVTFINLPVRCGHQYGPNSVGIHLADSEYLAYLNHDDLWLPDHLELAVEALQRGGAGAYLGRAAFCHPKGQPDLQDPNERLMFSELNRPDVLWRCMNGPFYLFEPASAWVVRTGLAKKVGSWNPPDQVDVTPVMDWLMRLAGAGARFHIADRVSVLKVNLHNSRAQIDMPTYYQEDLGSAQIDRLITLGADQLRAEIDEDLSLAETRGLLVRRDMVGPIEMTPQEQDRVSGFLLYLQTGIVSPSLIGPPIGPYKAGKALKILAHRTGENIAQFLPVAEVLALFLGAQGRGNA